MKGNLGVNSSPRGGALVSLRHSGMYLGTGVEWTYFEVLVSAVICCPTYCLKTILMRMGVHTLHIRVRISGFWWPIGQNNPRNGQNHFSLRFLAQKCPFLTLRTLSSACVRDRRLSPSPGILRVLRIYFSIFEEFHYSSCRNISFKNMRILRHHFGADL